MKQIGVYKITSPTNKIYIGQSTDIDKRWYHYNKLRCKGQPQLYNSLKFHGAENHTFEILEICNATQLDERELSHKQTHTEQHGWDSVMFTMLNDGKGGNKSTSTKQKMSLASTKQNRKINAYTLDGTFVSTFNSASEAKSILFADINENTGSILSSCRRDKQKTCRGYIFQFTDDDQILIVLDELKQNVKIKQQTILQYDTQDNFIREYQNSYQVEKEFALNGIRINSTDVRACCTGKQKTCKGYKWMYGTSFIKNNTHIVDTNDIELKKQELHILQNTHLNHTQYLINFIKSIYGGEILVNQDSIDIFIPEHSLAINIIYLEQAIYKPNQYYRNLFRKYIQDNIKLINIFSDEILTKPKIVLSRIQNELKLNTNTIYARKCVIKEISADVKNKFLDTNHIQGMDRSQFKLGLFHNHELVSVMTFRKPRQSIGQTKTRIENSWELIRFCNQTNTNVVGSASKLLKHFIKNYTPSHIFSFADNRWSSPLKNVYTTCGFDLTSTSQHGYWYTKDFISRLHRFNFNKGRLKQMGMDTENHTEYQLMQQIGYHRIWDCGVTRFEMHLTHPIN